MNFEIPKKSLRVSWPASLARCTVLVMLLCVVVMAVSCSHTTTATYSGHIVDVLQHRIFDGEVTVEDGVISDVRECALPEGKDYPYIMPGFIDSHNHIESSMVLPQEYAKVAVRHGTIGIVSDPHEIGNVLGKEGVVFMVEQGKRTPFKILFGAPSCVPSCPHGVETNGAVIDAKDVAELLAMPEIGFLTEMMDFEGVLNHDREVLAKIEAAHKMGKPVDGHIAAACHPRVRGAAHQCQRHPTRLATRWDLPYHCGHGRQPADRA